MNTPQVVDNCIYKNEPPWTPEEAENFQRDMDRLLALWERIEEIDVEEDTWNMELRRDMWRYQKEIEERRKNGGI